MTKPDTVTPLAEMEAAASDKLERLLAILVCQNRQPCISGDMRDRLSSMQRRQVSDAALGIMEEVVAPLCAIAARVREAEEARDVFIELNRIGSENAETERAEAKAERDAALAALAALRAATARMRGALITYNHHMNFRYEGLTDPSLHQTDASVWDKVINALASEPGA
jgi:hypothetical protein